MVQRTEQHLIYGTARKHCFVHKAELTFDQLSTLLCVFTLDRIGRRVTLYWGSIAQGIFMFLAGGMMARGQEASAAGDSATASQYGAAASAFIVLFTFAFGATWLTVPWLYPAECFSVSPDSNSSNLTLTHDSCKFEQKATHGAS